MPSISRSLNRLAGQRRAEPVAEGCDAEFDRVHRHLRPGEDRLKHQEQDRPRESAGPSTGCSTNASRRSLKVTPSSAIAADRLQDPAHLRLVVFDIRVGSGVATRPACARRYGAAIGRALRSTLERRAVLTPTVSTTGTPSSAAKRSRIDHDALAARDVGHVERHHHGQPQALQTQNQAQVLAQIRRIGDADDRNPAGSRRRAGLTARRR